MVNQISVVINTFNEEGHIERVVNNVGWADEIVIVDSGSTDRTLEILRRMKIGKDKLKIFKIKSIEYVEQARNFAISKASHEWILILDADEEIIETLAKKLEEIAEKMHQIDYVRVPRKNIIFRRFMQHSGWWPDYNIRFFKKGKVRWTDKIHRPPEASGQGLDLPPDEEYAIVHRSYGTISQFMERMDRYTGVQAKELIDEGCKFDWKDLFEKPLREFLSRFFANSGYKDGLHGLSLSLLQAFSFAVVYLKLWEKEKFRQQDIDLLELSNLKNQSSKAFNYWINRSKHPGNFFERIFKKIKS